jgi:hypothetical protein
MKIDHRRLLACTLGCALGVLLCSGAHAQTPVKFALDWKFEGPAAPYFVAILVRLCGPGARALVNRTQAVARAEGLDSFAARCFVVLMDRKLRIRRP